MKAKLAFYVKSLAGGGAERVMVTLANHYAAQGHSVTLVLAVPNLTYASELHPAVPIHFLRSRRRSTLALELGRFLRKERFDALLATIFGNNFIAVMAKLLTRPRTRVVIREASTPSVDMLLTPMTPKEKSKALAYYRWLYPRADAIVAPSRGVARDLQEFAVVPSSKLHVIYNPVLNDSIYHKAQEVVSHPWLQNKTLPVILGVGRLNHAKGYETLLEAHARVLRTYSARLLILGEGELRDSLTQLAHQLGTAEHVDLPGFDSNPFRYMRRADVFVLSSRYEGLPNVLIQALALGCPVVSTNCPSGPEEILDGGKYGELVPVGDADAMAQAILRVLDGERRLAPPEWLEQFRVEVVAEQYLKVLLGEV